jgi:hypothetical protein
VATHTAPVCDFVNWYAEGNVGHVWEAVAVVRASIGHSDANRVLVRDIANRSGRS